MPPSVGESYITLAFVIRAGSAFCAALGKMRQAEPQLAFPQVQYSLIYTIAGHLFEVERKRSDVHFNPVPGGKQASTTWQERKESERRHLSHVRLEVLNR